MIVKESEMQALARYLSALRPEWGEVGIVQALRAAIKDHDWLSVQLEAIRVAADGQARTPAAINQPERWTRAVSSAPQMTGTFCPKCRQVQVRGLDHSCTPGDPALGISLVRSAFRPDSSALPKGEEAFQ